MRTTVPYAIAEPPSERSVFGEPARRVIPASDPPRVSPATSCQPSRRAGERAAERGHDWRRHEFEQRVIVGQRRDLFEQRR
jgi:hypothetical protein